MLSLATVVATMLRFRARACVVLACVAAMLCATSTASAQPAVQAQTRIWDFSFASPLNVCHFCSASPRTHPGNQSSNLEVASASPHAARGAPKVLSDVVLKGGRSGQNVKNLVGPPNAAVRGGGQRAFVTNDKGQVILDITKTRVKPVTPGQGFGPKRAPTEGELKLLEQVLGGAK